MASASLFPRLQKNKNLDYSQEAVQILIDCLEGNRTSFLDISLDLQLELICLTCFLKLFTLEMMIKKHVRTSFYLDAEYYMKTWTSFLDKKFNPEDQLVLDLFFASAYGIFEFVLDPDVRKQFKKKVEEYHLDRPFLQSLLAFCYAKAVGTDRNLALAIQLIQEPLQKEEPFALNAVAEYETSNKRVKEIDPRAVTYAELAAKKGFLPAFRFLAAYYEKGIVVERQTEHAFNLYKTAALHGHLPSILHLGVCYQKGMGIEQNEKKAMECFLEAVDLKSPYACHQVALCYLEGKGIDQNEKTAVEWLWRSVGGGCHIAYAELGTCYENGIGVDKDMEVAIQCYRKGESLAYQKYLNAERGDIRCTLRLSECYQYGIGMPVDEGEAFKHCSLAVAMGCDIAINRMGWYYERGIGVGMNFSKAFDHYQRASFHLHEGKFNLARCLYYGIGTEQNLVLAIDHLKELKAAGYRPAIELIEHIKTSNIGKKYFHGSLS